MPFSIIPFLLLIVPILEISVFVVVGGQIGVLSTIGLILLTAIIGAFLLRWQGFQVLSKLQTESDAGKIPGREIVHGAMILVAGVLLLTPGFVTDTIGFLLFIPGIRDVIWSAISSRVTVIGKGGFGSTFNRKGSNETEGDFASSRHEGDIIDLNPDEFSNVPNPSSPWTGADKKNDKQRSNDNS